MLGARARGCLDELDHRNALRVPVPGGDGEDLAVGIESITVSSGATQRVSQEQMAAECDRTVARLVLSRRDAEEAY
eukprot:8850529-Lingulodinium_polyedra.AAC.1